MDSSIDKKRIGIWMLNSYFDRNRLFDITVIDKLELSDVSINRFDVVASKIWKMQWI